MLLNSNNSKWSSVNTQNFSSELKVSFWNIHILRLPFIPYMIKTYKNKNKSKLQYLILCPLLFWTILIRFGIDSIVRSITSLSKFINVHRTRSANSSFDSDVICSRLASARSLFFARWNTFSIGFRSGLRAGIFWRRHTQMSLKAFSAALEFCTGHPSWYTRRKSGLMLFRNALGKHFRIIFAKSIPLQAPTMRSHSTTPRS